MKFDFKKFFGLDSVKSTVPTNIEANDLDLKLDQVLADYDVIDVVPATSSHDAFMVVAQKADVPEGIITFSEKSPWYSADGYYPPVVAASADQQGAQRYLKEQPKYGEIGSSSPSPYTGFTRREYNENLIGNKGLIEYNKMRSDGVVSGSLLLFKTPVHAANWFIEPADQDDISIAIGKFVWKCLTEFMSITWTQVKTEAMLECDFGYYMFEKVWEKRKIVDELSDEFGNNRIVLKKVAPRHPLDVIDWNYDDNGGPESVDIYSEKNEGVSEVTIPISKLIVFSLNREGGDITGRSVLRSVYKHWYYKEALYKIDAIQKERHGIGIPIILLPPNFTDEDKIAANTLGRNLRTNERAHIVLPPGWEVKFAKLEGQPVDVIKSIEMHDKAIRENILAGFLSGDNTTKEEDLGLFLKASRFVADSICDAFNLYLIPELVRYNFGKDITPPKLRVRRIGEQADWRVLAFAIRNLIGAGVIRPDDKLEENLREEMDLPVADINTVRMVQAPQASQAAPATVPNATPGQPDTTSNGATSNSSTSNTGKTDGTASGVGLPRAVSLPNVKPQGGNAGADKGGQS